MGNFANPGARAAPYRRRTQTKKERFDMQTYVILRRNGWRSGEELEAAAERSTIEGDAMANDIRWIRSYVIEETAGGLGTVCIYQASSPEAIREHAERVGMPADEIMPVADTVIVRPDPERVTA
jgi:hypothetical protein